MGGVPIGADWDPTPMDVTERDASDSPAARSHAAVPTFPLRAPSLDFAALDEAEVAWVLQPEAAAVLDEVAGARNVLPQVVRLHRERIGSLRERHADS